MKKSKRERRSPGDLALALVHAREFHLQSLLIFNEIPHGYDEGRGHKAHQFFMSETGFGRLSFYATTQIFATELLLKAFHLWERRWPLSTHSVLDLYEEISEDGKARIERRYKQEIDRYPGSPVLSLSVGAARPAQKFPVGDAFTDIRRILQQTGDGYMSWRYVYEQPDHSRKEHHFYWCHLHCLCVALDEVLPGTLMRPGGP